MFLACDASEKGLGACISKHNAVGQEQVIEYASKSLTKAEVNYSQIEKEALSITYGIQKLQNYLLGLYFILRTDHRQLVTIFDTTRISVPTRTSSRLTRWALQLSQRKYNIECRSSSSHENADAWSRLSIGLDKTFDQFRQKDEEAEQFVASLETQNIRNGPIVYKQLQKYVRKDAFLQEIIR